MNEESTLASVMWHAMKWPMQFKFPQILSDDVISALGYVYYLKI